MRRANLRAAGTLSHSCSIRSSQSAQASFVVQTARLQCKQIPQVRLLRPIGVRLASTVTSATSAAKTSPRPTSRKNQTPLEISDPTELANKAEESVRKFLLVDGIPTKELTAAALQSCLRAASSLQPHLKRAVAKSRASASRLAELGAERTGTKLPIDATINEAVSKISKSAYTIMAEPNVEMTPEFLETYVLIQSQLGRPESLPTVLDMYATKRKPIMKDGEIRYVSSNPNMPVKAIETDVADMALRTAINAKNLDSALGIIESSVALPAFRRQKLVKHGTGPAIGLACLPFGIFSLASAYAAHWQNVVDITTATGIAALGISTYFLSVGGLGMIAKLSYMNQMRRVTWAPGTPLRLRWLREEERAALDAVACAWGFKESWRHGEETGPEWEGLREYMGYRQMVLDRVEFMEGMS
jgi:hypothetical protein